jgi:hypothetical protein
MFYDRSKLEVIFDYLPTVLLFILLFFLVYDLHFLRLAIENINSFYEIELR